MMNCLRLMRLVHKPGFGTIQFTTSAAKYNQHPIKFIETQDRWRHLDNVSARWELIYKAPMEKWLKYLSVYLTFSTTTITGAGLYYTAFVFDKNNMNDPILLGDDVVIANSALEYFVYIGAFILFHAAIKVLLSKYVIRIYQDGEKYMAIFKGHTFNSIKKHEFHLKEFKKLSPTFVVSWGDARFSLGGKHAIILENYFKTPEYFNYLLHKRKAENPQ